MGLRYHMVEALIREHIHKPISGDVVLVGRQTVYFSPQTILALLREHGVTVDGVDASDIEIDRSTVNRLSAFADDSLITDTALFRLLGVPRVLALDHSDYEGAELIHDLAKPLPSELRNCADFIVDGSTLDNTFDPAMVMRNFAEMLRPGGRIIMTNVFSNHYEPYAILPPLWYLDYFVANGFADCKVYVLVLPWMSESTTQPQNASDVTDVFYVDLDALLDPSRRVSSFVSPRMMSTIVFAEKASESTTHVGPVQQHYRSEADWIRHRENLHRIRSSQRPHLVRSRGNITLFDVRSGHLFMAGDFTARDPMTEIRKLTQREPANDAAPRSMRSC